MYNSLYFAFDICNAKKLVRNESPKYMYTKDKNNLQLNTIYSENCFALIERLILASTNEHDIVLDPFSGVGTSAVVCEKHNRNWILFEKNSIFVEQANKRLLKENVI